MGCVLVPAGGTNGGVEMGSVGVVGITAGTAQEGETFVLAGGAEIASVCLFFLQ